MPGASATPPSYSYGGGAAAGGGVAGGHRPRDNGGRGHSPMHMGQAAAGVTPTGRNSSQRGSAPWGRDDDVSTVAPAPHRQRQQAPFGMDGGGGAPSGVRASSRGAMSREGSRGVSPHYPQQHRGCGGVAAGFSPFAGAAEGPAAGAPRGRAAGRPP